MGREEENGGDRERKIKYEDEKIRRGTKNEVECGGENYHRSSSGDHRGSMASEDRRSEIGRVDPKAAASHPVTPELADALEYPTRFALR